jgi:hypothetical protein
MDSIVGTVKVKVVPDLSGFQDEPELVRLLVRLLVDRHAREPELARLLATHIYGDDRDDGSVCTRIVDDLLARYIIIPR